MKYNHVKINAVLYQSRNSCLYIAINSFEIKFYIHTVVKVCLYCTSVDWKFMVNNCSNILYSFL